MMSGKVGLSVEWDGSQSCCNYGPPVPVPEQENIIRSEPMLLL